MDDRPDIPGDCHPGYSQLSPKSNTLFQTSTISALLEGVYDGETTYKALKQYGDFGLGTFDGLDGEMIGLEGKFYQVKADGLLIQLMIR